MEILAWIFVGYWAIVAVIMSVMTFNEYYTETKSFNILYFIVLLAENMFIVFIAIPFWAMITLKNK